MMSWFDGVIPEVCMNCFVQTDSGWRIKPEVECDDGCDYFLAMFPVVSERGRLLADKMEILHLTTGEPKWKVESDKL